MAAQPRPAENLVHAARHCLPDMPYRMIVFNKQDPNGVALYSVAGSADPPKGAAKALKTAHNLHGGKCHFCKKPVNAANFTIDHAEPQIRGGRDDIQNLLVSCKACNAEKGHQVIEAFCPAAGREWLAALLIQVQDRLNRIQP